LEVSTVKKRIYRNGLFFDVFPHVYPPQSDTLLLLEHLSAGESDSVLELGVGCGLIALCLSLKAKAVVGVDSNHYAIQNAIHNAKQNNTTNARFIHGDLYEPVNGMQFDLIYANPPYVPTPPDWIETDIIETAWNAGCNGRKVLDRIIDGALEHLNQSSRIVLVQSSLADIPKTIEALESSGFQTRILAEKKEKLGPISMARLRWLESQGMLVDSLYERLVVVEGRIWQ
jgi:release factor glutamine methyltransferase